MNLPVIVLIAVVGLVIVTALLKAKKGGLGVDVYRRQGELFSAAELRFLVALDQAIAPGQRVLGKVRVADLISIGSGLNPKVRQIAINKVAQKHFDFVVCTGPSLVPVCAIELNDSSHKSSTTKRRDDFLSSVCTQVGLPLIMVKAAHSYAPDAMRQQLAEAIQSGNCAPTAPPNTSLERTRGR